MAHTNVSSSVLTIIASFSNGLDVLKKLRRSGRKSNNHHAKMMKRNEGDAARLSRSLRHGPEDIGREYQAWSMRCDSEQYAKGDATAQTCLAEILLKLNTGLVGIITTFLSRGKNNGLDLDYHSLADLSEQSRLQTVGVLRELYQRLMSKDVLPQAVPSARSGKSKAKKPNHDSPTKHNKKRQPTLARVMIENSSVPSQIAMVRSSEARKQRTTTHLRSSTEPRKPHGGFTPSVSILELMNPPPPYLTSDTMSKQAPSPSKPHRHQQYSVSLSKPRTPPQQETHKPLPPEASTTPFDGPLHSKVNITIPTSQTNLRNSSDFKSRHRPDTFYSTGSARTGSTKLGEIPMERWMEPWDHEAAEKANEVALASGWPISEEARSTRPTKFGWRRWFGRSIEAN